MKGAIAIDVVEFAIANRGSVLGLAVIASRFESAAAGCDTQAKRDAALRAVRTAWVESLLRAGMRRAEAEDFVLHAECSVRETLNKAGEQPVSPLPWRRHWPTGSCRRRPAALVYRVAHRETGCGPYRSLGYDAVHGPGDQAARHPNPTDDFARAFAAGPFQFGFGSWAQLRAWFTAHELRGLRRRGFHIRVLAVPHADIITGGAQVAFPRRSYPSGELAWLEKHDPALLAEWASSARECELARGGRARAGSASSARELLGPAAPGAAMD